MKPIVIRQYQEIVDKTASRAVGLSVPPEGWLRTVRRAIGMSGAQLSRLLHVSRSQIAQAEKNELAGTISLQTLQRMAEAMGCRVVYALVPESSAADLVAKRARVKAEQIIGQADTHMALESQTLNQDQREFELARLQRELINEMPSDLWNDI